MEKIMAKQQYNRPAIKLEFFESDIDEVESFFQDKFKTKTDWSIRKNTKWRTKEKQERKAKIVEKAIQRNAEKQAKELEIPIETLLKAKKMAVIKIIRMMSEQDLSMNDLSKWLEKIKTELWEPDHIGANYNVNTNKNEWLTDEEIEAIELLFQAKGWSKKKQ